MIDFRANALFAPADPPRHGRLVVWGGDIGPGHAGEVTDIELVLPTPSMVRRKRVVVRAIPLAQALPVLVAMGAAEDQSPSFAAWAAAARMGSALVARGRLVPAVTGSGLDAWRVGPLDPSDLRQLEALAAAFTPEAHALPMPATRPLRVHSPAWLVRQLWDAVADVLVRSPAAARTVSNPAFAAVDATPVGHLREWLAVADRGLVEGAQPVLRLEVPDADGGFRASLQLRSRSDPSLVIDAAELWGGPAPVLARFGDGAEADLLLALRRAARVWAPAGRALEHPTPTVIELDDEEATALVGSDADRLAAAGFEVLWPSELAFDELALRVVVGTPSPAKVTGPVFTLEALLEFRWEVALGGQALTREELDLLSEAKRPLVRLRGRWVLADPVLLERLRRRQQGRLRAGDALSAALTGDITIDGEVFEVRVEGPLASLADRLAALDHSREMPEPAGLDATLRPYQRRGLAWLAEMCALGLGGCLADDMGLGKTVQVIALHLSRQDAGDGAPALVVCPASLLGNWERELRRFAPGIAVRRYHGGGRHLDDLVPGEVVLATYGMVRRDRPALAEVGWDLVVADEAQHAKNPLSRTARELRRLPARARVALTGTPVENRLSDLWSILDWTTPGLLGPLDGFRRAVAMPVERYRDPAATEHLTRTVRPFLLRRRKIDPDIAPELPPKTETDVVVPLTSEQATLYEAVVREAMADIEAAEGIARRGLVLKLLTSLKQVCNHPAHYLHQKGPLAGRSGKLAALDELLDIIVDEGASALVFTQYVAMARLIEAHLAERGTPTLFLHGGVEARRRDDMVVRFQARQVPVFLLSLKAGGTGLNLTAATHVLHFDRWWNPAVEDQASDRAYRIGQDRPVQVHRLVTEGTLEERIAVLLESKRELAEAVVGAGEAWISDLSDEELAALVSLRGER